MRERKDYFPVLLGVLLGAMVALLILACSNYGMIAAKAEGVKSPSLSNYVWIRSDDGMEFNNSAMELYPADIVKIRIDPDQMEGKTIVKAVVSLPMLPERLFNVVLTDGWTVSYSVWEIIDDHTVSVSFAVKDIKKFYQTNNLYMVFVSTIPVD